MTRIRKVKRRKTYKVNINRKRLRNKMRKLPSIPCTPIKEAWERNKSTKSNLRRMGLAYDANVALQIPNTGSTMVKNAKKKLSGELMDVEVDEKPRRVAKKINVAQALEEDAKAPRERMFRLPAGQVQFITYLMNKYEDDYKAMARDKKNYNQLTWKQIRSKVNTFKGIPEQYAEYLLKKGEIVLENPTPLEQTKKEIAAENFKKNCTSKKSTKKTKTPASQWVEESISNHDDDDGDFETTKTLEDEPKQKSKGHENKLQLFSDDEDDENLFKNLSDVSEDELSLSEDDLEDDSEFVSSDSD